MVTKGELFAKLGELLDDAEIRFVFASEEMEVEPNISIEPEMNEAWITLYPKAETEEETGPWYVGRRPEGEQYVGRHRKD